MTVSEAKRRCASDANCAGFSYNGPPHSSTRHHVILKNKFVVHHGVGWTSYRRNQVQARVQNTPGTAPTQKHVQQPAGTRTGVERGSGAAGEPGEMREQPTTTRPLAQESQDQPPAEQKQEPSVHLGQDAGQQAPAATAGVDQSDRAEPIPAGDSASQPPDSQVRAQEAQEPEGASSGQGEQLERQTGQPQAEQQPVGQQAGLSQQAEQTRAEQAGQQVPQAEPQRQPHDQRPAEQQQQQQQQPPRPPPQPAQSDPADDDWAARCNALNKEEAVALLREFAAAQQEPDTDVLVRCCDAAGISYQNMCHRVAARAFGRPLPAPSVPPQPPQPCAASPPPSFPPQPAPAPYSAPLPAPLSPTWRDPAPAAPLSPAWRDPAPVPYARVAPAPIGLTAIPPLPPGSPPPPPQQQQQQQRPQSPAAVPPLPNTAAARLRRPAGPGCYPIPAPPLPVAPQSPHPFAPAQHSPPARRGLSPEWTESPPRPRVGRSADPSPAPTLSVPRMSPPAPFMSSAPALSCGGTPSPERSFLPQPYTLPPATPEGDGGKILALQVARSVGALTDGEFVIAAARAGRRKTPSPSPPPSPPHGEPATAPGGKRLAAGGRRGRTLSDVAGAALTGAGFVGTPCEPVTNLCKRYGVSVKEAEDALRMHSGHAGRAGRYLERPQQQQQTARTGSELDKLEQLFTRFDRDCDSFWNFGEARRFMYAVSGCLMEQREWEEQCAELGADPELGLTKDIVKAAYDVSNLDSEFETAVASIESLERKAVQTLLATTSYGLLVDTWRRLGMYIRPERSERGGYKERSLSSEPAWQEDEEEEEWDEEEQQRSEGSEKPDPPIGQLAESFVDHPCPADSSLGDDSSSPPPAIEPE
eukprot:TRINITY_DN2083_c2_g2_i2.p1 TRINITY_DN2083_c2_g2~~TRINITY_DN2083_c2_g2_i2.p1  ORF type:complete len:1018 (+),score=271.70 TRINITY_DN2083_c2_g2_i2:452-3055(+)